MSEYDGIGIYLEKEEKDRVDTFLLSVDHLFWTTLSRKQRKIYNAYQAIQMFSEHGMTVEGYLQFLDCIRELIVLTGLPLSLEADYAGLGSWDAWNAVSDRAFESIKRRRKCRRGKVNK